jgi:hypothetical protein
VGIRRPLPSLFITQISHSPSADSHAPSRCASKAMREPSGAQTERKPTPRLRVICGRSARGGHHEQLVAARAIRREQ